MKNAEEGLPYRCQLRTFAIARVPKKRAKLLSPGHTTLISHPDWLLRHTFESESPASEVPPQFIARDVHMIR